MLFEGQNLQEMANGQNIYVYEKTFVPGEGGGGVSVTAPGLYGSLSKNGGNPERQNEKN